MLRGAHQCFWPPQVLCVSLWRRQCRDVAPTCWGCPWLAGSCGLPSLGGISGGLGSRLPVGQRDHPVGGVGLLLALDFLSRGFFKRRRQVAQVGVEFLGHKREGPRWTAVAVPPVEAGGSRAAPQATRSGLPGGQGPCAGPRPWPHAAGPAPPVAWPPLCHRAGPARALTAILFLIRDSLSWASASSALASSSACRLGATSQ